MANTIIKISQLANINGNLTANTLLPVVSTNGAFATDKVNVSNLANFILAGAGNSFANVNISQLSYNVVNAAQPNITSVGTLNSLNVVGDSNLGPVSGVTILGGNNGYFLQTDGTGNLSWAASGGGGGNGSPGGANTQIQYNDGGSFNGSPFLSWDAGNAQLNTVKIGASNVLVYGTVDTIDVVATGNISAVNVAANNFTANTLTTTGNITANYFIGNGSQLTGVIANAGGPNTAVQFKSNGGFAGNSDFSYDEANSVLGVPNLLADNIQVLNTSSLTDVNFSGNIQGGVLVSANSLAGDGANISNITGANVSGTVANAEFSNTIYVEPVNNNWSYHVVLTTGAGDYTLHNDADDNFQYNPQDGILTVTRLDATYVLANLAFANGYPANKIDGLGNIATINLTGSSSNVLYGNGAFAPAAGGTPSQLVNSSATLTLESNGDVTFPSTAKVVNGGNNLNFQPGNGGVTQIFSDDGSNVWSFQNYNSFELPENGNIYTYGNLKLQAGSNTWSFEGNTSILRFPDGSVIEAGGLYGNDTAVLGNGGGQVEVYTQSSGVGIQTYDGANFYTWFYDNDGNLTLPGNTWAVNYANGTQVPLGGGGGLPLSNGNSIIDIATVDGNITLDANGKIFTFGTDGILTFPASITNMYAGADNDFIIATSNSNAATYYFTFTQLGSLTVPVDIDVLGNVNASDIVGTSNGNVTVTANTQSWLFDTNGVLSKADANGLVLAANYSAQIITDYGDNDRTWLFDGTSGELVLPGGNVLIDPTDDNFEVRGAQSINFEANTVVNIYTDTSNNAYQWQFGTDGNLTLPAGGNINYANGDVYGSGFNPFDQNLNTTDNVQFANVTSTEAIKFNNSGNIVGAIGYSPTSVNIEGWQSNTVNIITNDLNTWTFGTDGFITLPGEGVLQSIDDTVTLRSKNSNSNVVNGVYVGTSGGLGFFDSAIPGNWLEIFRLGVDPQIATTGNLLIRSDSVNTAPTWNFDNTGNLILPGNGVILNPANSSLDPLNPNVSTMVLTPDQGYSSQSLVLDPTAPGHIHLRSPGANIDEPYANIFLGGENSSFEVGVYNGSAPNLFIHSGGNTWTFDNTGSLGLPGGTGAIESTPNNVSIYNQASQTNGVVIWGDGLGNAGVELQSDGMVSIVTDNSNSSYQTVFLANGNLQTAGGITPVDPNNFDIGNSNHHFRDAYFSGNVNADTFKTTDGGITHTGSAVGITADAGKDVYLSADGGNVGWLFTTGGNLEVPGHILYTAGASPAPYISGFSSANLGVVITPPVAYASLTAVAGARAFISDGNLVSAGGGSFGAQVGGGGSNICPVWSDGVNWYIG